MQEIPLEHRGTSHDPKHCQDTRVCVSHLSDAFPDRLLRETDLDQSAGFIADEIDGPRSARAVTGHLRRLAGVTEVWERHYLVHAGSLSDDLCEHGGQFVAGSVVAACDLLEVHRLRGEASCAAALGERIEVDTC